MNRLTKRDFDFTSDFVASRLQSWPIAEALKKLQQYENAEEDGRLIILPFKVDQKMQTGSAGWLKRMEEEYGFSLSEDPSEEPNEEPVEEVIYHADETKQG